MSGALTAVLFGGLALGWALQLLLVMRQTQRFQRELRSLRAVGTTAVGRDGSRMRGYVYVAIAADPGGRVVAARQMTGFTVFSRLRPAPDLVGRSVHELVGADDGRLARAAAMAAGAIVGAAEDGTIQPLTTPGVRASVAH